MTPFETSEPNPTVTKNDESVAQYTVESDKSMPRLKVDWSILASVMDTPFPHSLEIAGS